jgi:hypothetical protein
MAAKISRLKPMAPEEIHQDPTLVETFPIEDGIPLPPRKGGGRPRLYHLDKLEVGQSIFVPREQGRLNPGSIAWAQRGGKKFTQRRGESAEGVPGVRIWRLV